MNNQKNIPIKQRGASLLEIIAYLSVAAIVIIGAVMMMQSAFSGANSNRLLSEVVGLQMNVKKLTSGQQVGFGVGNLNTLLANAAKLPGTLRVDAAAAPATITNNWNAAVVVTGATNTFTISYAGIPKDVCIEVVSAQGSSGFLSVSVNGAAALVPPISTATAAGATGCTVAANTVVWTSN